MRYMVLWVPDWPVNCLVIDLPPGGSGAVVDGDKIAVASAAARRAGIRSGMSLKKAMYLCPDLVHLPRDRDREARSFSAVIDAFDTVAAGVECLRPGVARCHAHGPARWAGSEEKAASLLVDAIEAAVGVECFVGIAEGPLASLMAARQGRIVAPDDTQSFLSGVELTHALECVPPHMRDRATASIGLLEGLGVRRCADFLALGRGPVLERFGDVGERLWTLASGADGALTRHERTQSDISVTCEIDEGGDRIDTMIAPITRAAATLSRRLYESGVVSQTLRIDVEDAGGGARSRTWSGCDLAIPSDVALRVRWTLSGWMSGAEGPSGQASSIRLTACDPRAGTSPSALWGRSEREQDVSRSAVRIQALVGPDALLVPRVQGGYDPRSRVVMARWGSEPVLRPFEGAWEGGVTTAPATLFDEPPRVRILPDSPSTADVRVDSRGRLTATPAYLVEAHSASPALTGAAGAGSRVRICRVRGPWPVRGRWWAREAPRAYMRAQLEDGRTTLLVWNEGEWALEGVDD